MKPITRAELTELVARSRDDEVSIYMPGYVGAESRQNSVRFKNLLTEAETKLLDKGLRRPAVEALLAPARELLEEPSLWGRIGKGLAVFINGDGVRLWKLPFACDELCVVGKEIYVIPLLIWLSNEASYYVLAFSQNQLRVLYGTSTELEEIDVPGLPSNRDEALRLDEPESIQQAHVSRTLGAGRGDLMFHGHGGAPDDNKVELELFMREIDRPLSDFLRLETKPLVFVGVDYLFPIFEQVNNYPYLLPTPVTGNPELWSLDELRNKVWPLVEPILVSRRQEALAKYGDVTAQGRALHELEDVLVAAHAGAVETLFVDPRARQWGAFSPTTSQVRFDESAQQDSEDLINLAATFVLRNSGAVIPLDKGNMPGGGDVAATMRYAFPPAQSPAGSAAPSRT